MNREPSEFTYRPKPTMHEILPADELALLKEQVRLFAEKYNIHPHIADALQPEKVLMFATGLPDQDKRLMKEYVLNLSLALQLFEEDMAITLSDELTPIDYDQDDEAGRLRRNISKDNISKLDIFTNNFQGTLQASRELGVCQSKVIEFILNQLRMMAFHLYGSKLSIKDIKVELADADASLVRNESGVPSTSSRLAARLEKEGISDLSQESFDARMAHFKALAQLELARFALHDWLDLRRVAGGDAHQSEGFYFMLDSLEADNLAYKNIIYSDLASYVLRFDGVINPQIQATIAERIQAFSIGINAVLRIFHAIYEAKDFTIESLFDFQAALDISTNPLDVMLDRLKNQRRQLDDQNREKQEARRKLQQEQDAKRVSLQERHSALADQYKIAQKPWEISAGKRKELGLTDLLKSLRNGFTLATGEHVIINIPVEETVAMTSILIKLNQLIQSADQTESMKSAQTELTAALSLHTALHSELIDIQEEARTLKVTNLSHIEIFPLQKSIGYLKNQWPAFEKLIIETWPQNMGRHVAERIKTLLEITD